MSAPRFYVVVDLEATCDDQGSVPKAEMEIIEIGSVLVDAETLEPIEEHQTFVRPVRHPKLTPFCTALTTIRQSDVDAAPSFPEAIDAVRRFLGDTGALLSSWGDYDRKQLEQDAAHHAVALPFVGGHLNIKAAFSERLGLKKKLGVSRALEHVGLRFEGTAHRGIDDARNIARLLPWALGRPPR